MRFIVYFSVTIFCAEYLSKDYPMEETDKPDEMEELKLELNSDEIVTYAAKETREVGAVISISECPEEISISEPPQTKYPQCSFMDETTKCDISQLISGQKG